MLTREELELPTERLAFVLVERLANVRNDDDAVPRALRDLAVLFELDAEVRNGGFAQYFFNRSCLQAFDAWFASEDIVPEAHGLLTAALKRLGSEFGVNLDLASVIEAGGGEALGPAYGSLLGIYRAEHERAGELFVRFGSFRDRLAGPRGGLEGFDALNMRFFQETNVSTAVAERVKESPDEFL